MDLAHVQALLGRQWSPEQVASYLRRQRLLQISHEPIYRYIWADKRHGGQLYTHLRGARKQRRKRYRSQFCTEKELDGASAQPHAA